VTLPGEAAIQASSCDRLVLRTTRLRGARGNNRLQSILQIATARDSLGISDDRRVAPTRTGPSAHGSARFMQREYPAAAVGLADADSENTGLASRFALQQTARQDRPKTTLENAFAR
jgi:dTDP-4-dehydrorhamnose reductase